MAQNSKTELLIQIHDLIDDTFDLEEFRDLCLRLGVKYDNLRGETLSDRIHDLVQRLNRQRRLDDLLNFCARLRPKVEWPDLSVPVDLDTAPAPFTAPPRNPRQIFLSHARQDAEFAHRLAADLRRHGWAVWIAPDSTHPGEGWVNAINRGLAESGIFLLALTPEAVASTWVHSETNVAIGLQHQKALRFIPLDVKAAAAPPLWQAYQWISFQNDYKVGLEQLLQELQPEKMAQIARWYRRLQEVMGRRQWAEVQQVGAQIRALYPDYRETESQMALAQREEAREKAQQAEAAKLYDRLQAAFAAADWTAALALASQVEALVPNYRDVKQLTVHARQGQRSNRRDVVGQKLRHIPALVWGGGAVVGVLALILIFQLAGGGGRGDPGVTPTMTVPAISQTTPETPTAAVTPKSMTPIRVLPNTVEPEVTDTQQPTTTPISTPTNTPTVTLTPVPGIGSTRIRPADDAVMVFVPAGEFVMGSEDGEDNEKPLHTVYLDSFWIDQTEVTNGMYALCVRAGDCVEPSSLASSTRVNYYPNPAFANFPVLYVRWNAARTYCEWAGGRLPTEAEWEKAARWDEGNQEARTYPWGETVDCDHANYNRCMGDTTAVGSYPEGVSPYGAFDMAGNVWEWVADWYASDYYAGLVYDNPTGSTTGRTKVLRGGSWDSSDRNARAAFRNNRDPASRFRDQGFRCAQ